MKKVLLALATFVGSSALLIACNSGGGSSSTAVTTPQACSQNGQSYTNSCGTANYVSTQYGCLPMYNSDPCYGNYNGQKVPVTGSTNGFNYGPGNVNGYGYQSPYYQQYYNGYNNYNSGYSNNNYYGYGYSGYNRQVPLVPGFMGGFQAGIYFY